MSGDPVWPHARELGYGEATTFLASTPVAVVAGFVLATAAAFVDRSQPLDALGQVALGLLILSAALLLGALVLAFYLRMWLRTPALMMEWRPEVARDPTLLEHERQQFADDLVRDSKLIEWTTTLVGLGLGAALIGLGLLVMSYETSVGYVLAAGVACVAAIPVCLLLLFGGVRDAFERTLLRAAARDAKRARARASRRREGSPAKSAPAHQTQRQSSVGVELEPLDPATRSLIVGDTVPDNATGVLTRPEIAAIAKACGVGQLYQECSDVLARLDGVYSGNTSLVATAVIGNRHVRVIALHPLIRHPERGLAVSVDVVALSEWSGRPPDEIRRLLPSRHEEVTSLGVLMWVDDADVVQQLLHS